MSISLEENRNEGCFKVSESERPLNHEIALNNSKMNTSENTNKTMKNNENTNTTDGSNEINKNDNSKNVGDGKE